VYQAKPIAIKPEEEKNKSNNKKEQLGLTT